MLGQRSPLYSCPPEIWTEILDFASLDDGFTIRSLCQVSPFIRARSIGHLHSSVLIESSSQLLKFDEELSRLESTCVGGKKPLRTRFLCIVLPAPMDEEAYVPSSEVGPEDEYQPSEPDSDEADETNSVSSESDASTSYEYEDLQEGEIEELVVEIGDIRKDTEENPARPLAIGDFTQLERSQAPKDQRQYLVYKALRRLLEACSETLETFALLFIPCVVLPHDTFIPALPRLQSLWIGMGKGTNLFHNYPDDRGSSAPPALFPSLRRLTLDTTLDVTWFEDLLQSVPNPSAVAFMGDERLKGYRGLKAKSIEPEQWIDLSTPDREDAVDFMITHWWEDVCGNDVSYIEGWELLERLWSRKAEREEHRLAQLGDTDMTCFNVKRIDFRVPRLAFIQGSEYFVEKHCLSSRSKEFQDHVHLDDVTPNDFLLFLKMLYPLSTGPTFSRMEWVAILYLSTMWHFSDIRDRAIQHLDNLMPFPPRERVWVGRKGYVPRWVLSAYVEYIQGELSIGSDIGRKAKETLDELRDRLQDEWEINGYDPEAVEGEVRREFAQELSRLEYQKGKTLRGASDSE
ncbi:hypothetical protein DFP72DRAFT_608343 [Ephemerocybe angulata]|uniref:BTB domain-containing protein n=1 Tax=Ephemerocybe angulata TaxID=980116 RepID=A0A8H6HHX0_9AGAR|nr:hypothetical protein DFP72DRAFT_608343 [Tulosesus angulatus]